MVYKSCLTQNEEILGKSQNLIELLLSAKHFSQKENFSDTSKNSLNVEISVFSLCTISDEK